MDIPPNWTPTPENINALPGPLRRYIHDLHTNADPAGTMRENFALAQENKFLRLECEQLSKSHNLPMTLEEWDQGDVRPIELLMRTNHGSVAVAGFDVMVKARPKARLYLRDRARIMRKHLP